MVIQFAFVGMGLLFLIGFAHALFAIRDHRPAVIINKDGIWVKYFGLTPWNNIEKIDLYTIYQTSMQYIGIQVNNVALLAQQAFFW